MHVRGWDALFAIAVSGFMPAICSAETSSDAGASSRSGDPRPPAARAAQPANGSKNTLLVDKTYSYQLDNGCKYAATIRGTIKATSAAPSRVRFAPNLTESATVSCPNAPNLKVSGNVLRTTALSRAELETAIAMRAALLEGNGRRCVYVPQFTLDRTQLQGSGVAYMCPAAAATGGGPSTQPQKQGESQGEEMTGPAPNDTEDLPEEGTE